MDLQEVNPKKQNKLKENVKDLTEVCGISMDKTLEETKKEEKREKLND